MDDGFVRIGDDDLRIFCARAFEAVGVPSKDALTTATLQVEADLRGVHSHGTRAVPRYVLALQLGGTNPRPQITVTSEGPAMAALDGDAGLGQVVASQAMAMAIDKARTSTIAAVGVQGSSHFGAAAHYAIMAAEAGMVGFATSVSGGSNQAAYGGGTPVVGNHPFSYAIPAGEERPIVLDMATGKSAHGKIALAKMAGKLMPAGYFLTREGVETRDPDLAATVTPAAGPKGYGLAITMDILAGVMLGDVASCHKSRREPDRPIGAGHFMMAINIASFRPLAEFRAEVDEQIRTIRGSKTLPGFERVYLPGELEWLKKEEQLRDGIALPADDVAKLEALGQELGITPGWKA